MSRPPIWTVPVSRSNATTTVALTPMLLAPRIRRPLSSSAPDHHTGTAAKNPRRAGHPREHCRQGAPTADLTDKQRRLRWALDALPTDLRGALPLVEHLAQATWQDDFRVVEPPIAEPDINEELRAARAQIAQGLPLMQPWVVDADLGQVGAGRRDAVSYLWQIRRGDETKRVQVFISGTALESANEH